MMIEACPRCGSTEFHQIAVIWPELAAEWKLSPEETGYTDRQQGYTCSGCGASLRSMTLVYAISEIYGCSYQDFLDSSLYVLEINEACHLHADLATMRNHTFAPYPSVDMMELPYPDRRFDLVIHSDTLEHVPDPVLGLRETYRVLRDDGCTLYTVPVIVGRLTRDRHADSPSYHGTWGDGEYLVVTEYGADMWTHPIEAGFHGVELHTLDFPASVAISAHKDTDAGASGGRDVARLLRAERDHYRGELDRTLLLLLEAEQELAQRQDGAAR